MLIILGFANLIFAYLWVGGIQGVHWFADLVFVALWASMNLVACFTSKKEKKWKHFFKYFLFVMTMSLMFGDHDMSARERCLLKCFGGIGVFLLRRINTSK